MKKYVINLYRRKDRLEQFWNTCPYDSSEMEILYGFDGKYPSMFCGWKPTPGSPRVSSVPLAMHFFELFAKSSGHSINLTSTEIACYISHLLVWIRIMEEEEDYAMVFEDDAIFCEGFLAKMAQIEKHLSLVDTILYIGGRITPEYRPIHCIPVLSEEEVEIVKHDYTAPMVRVHFDRTTHAYIVHKTHAKRMVECFMTFILSPRMSVVHFPVDQFMTQLLYVNKMNLFSSRPMLCHSTADNGDIEREYIDSAT